MTAQVVGDHQALRADGLPVVSVELDGDAATALQAFTVRVAGLLDS